MKVAILAGGVGTRLVEETHVKPKPMVEIGGRPIIWHILKHYARHGHNELFIAVGYKGELIEKYMVDYASMNHDLTVDLNSGAVAVHRQRPIDWSTRARQHWPRCSACGHIR